MLNEDQKEMLLSAALVSIKELGASKDSVSVKTWAFGHHSASTDEIFEVQVVVTRDETDFIDPYQSEHTVKF